MFSLPRARRSAGADSECSGGAAWCGKGDGAGRVTPRPAPSKRYGLGLFGTILTGAPGAKGVVDRALFKIAASSSASA